ncbi:MAG: glycosyltransferase family 4 protein [Duncaniella sp.]|nr:glycosyltransferase family 4 protein [Duncaniella sp.]
MKILYDHQIFGLQKFGGISRYFVELMSNLPEDIAFKNSLAISNNVYLKDADQRFAKGMSLPDFRGKYRIAKLINQQLSEFNIKNKKFDIFHPTYYDPYFLKALKKPYVITVHDMIHEKFSDMFRPDDPTREYKKKTVLNANKIIAISNHTKYDLLELYDIPENKIEVIHLGHSVNLATAESLEGLPEKYFLFVGQRKGYKNFVNFLKAFASFNKRYPEIKLVCTGKMFDEEEMTLIRSLGLNNEVSCHFVSDGQLAYLYQHALCFVYPSLYEGFGIPILEAFAAQCPIALSDTSCFPEIAQEGGIYFNPYEIDSMIEAFNKVVSDDLFRKEKIALGKNVLSQYSWQKMAQEIAEIYRTVV